ncbi:MAG TPA: (deoxy)nucleoside triphosphate pyrophosphohydrolase [Polyangiaceae bacterium]|jgi:mutator protein MutT
MTAPQIAVAIALVWRDGRVLVTRRRAAAHLGGMWEFPGGKPEPGETLAACAEREVREETGVVCRAYRERASIEHAYADRAVVLSPFDCRWVSGEARLEQVADALWVEPKRLRELEFPEANRALIQELGGQAPR